MSVILITFPTRLKEDLVPRKVFLSFATVSFVLLVSIGFFYIASGPVGLDRTSSEDDGAVEVCFWQL